MSPRLRPAHFAIALAAVWLAVSCTGDSSGNNMETVRGRPTRIAFRDVTEQMGIPTEKTRSWGAFWGNFDARGRLPDLFVSRHARPPWVMVRKGAGFEEDSPLPYYPAYFDRHGCAWGEANGDGRPDFLCAQGADAGEGSGANQLLIRTDEGLVDRARDFRVADPTSRGRSVNWIDYDGDGDLDVFLGNKFRRGGYGNKLLENTGKGFTWRRVGLEEEGLRTVNSTWADWDSDGDPDLLVLQYPPRPAVAYENRDGEFKRLRLRHITDDTWFSAAWGDFNGDGAPDLHLVSDSRSLILQNRQGRWSVVQSSKLNYGRMSTWIDVNNDGALDLFVVQGDSKEHPESPGNNHPDFILVQHAGEFKKVEDDSFAGPAEGYGDAVAAADYDRDGRMDLYVSNGHGPRPSSGSGQLLRNISDAGNWAGLELRGDDRNPLGFGTTVFLQAGELNYRRQLTDFFNFRSQNEPGYVHLGLATETAARLRVQWTDGVTDCLEVEAGDIPVLRKGTWPC